MKNIVLASVAVAIFGLAGCASNGDTTAPVTTQAAPQPVTYKAPPAAPPQDTTVAAGSNDPMMALCFENGGSIGEWPGADGATKTCDTPDGNSYPLASLTAFEAFQ